VANSAELKDRWKTLQLLGPVFELLNRAAPRGPIDHRSYDRAQLALRLIDYIRAQSGQPGGIGQSSGQAA